VATTLQASALKVRSCEIQKGIIAKAIGVAFAQLCDLDDAQGKHFSRRVPVGIGSKANPALLDGLPSLIKGVSQDFHLVGVEGSGKRVLYQYLKQGVAPPNTRKMSAATLTRIDDVLKKAGPRA
jgi:hypothetical protein